MQVATGTLGLECCTEYCCQRQITQLSTRRGREYVRGQLGRALQAVSTGPQTSDSHGRLILASTGYRALEAKRFHLRRSEELIVTTDATDHHPASMVAPQRFGSAQYRVALCMLFNSGSEDHPLNLVAADLGQVGRASTSSSKAQSRRGKAQIAHMPPASDGPIRMKLGHLVSRGEAGRRALPLETFSPQTAHAISGRQNEECCLQVCTRRAAGKA